MNKIKNIAVIAFDSKKTELIEWSYFNKEILSRHKITALGFTANILEGTLNKKVSCIEPGQTGGYRQIKNLIEKNLLDAVFIFGNPDEILENKHLNGLISEAIGWGLIVSTNRSTADFLISSALINSDYKKTQPEDKPVINNKVLDVQETLTISKAS